MKNLKILFIICFSFFLLSCAEKQGRSEGEYVDGKPVFQEGDVIGHYSEADYLQFFKIIENAKYNHVGIILDNDGELMVLEAVGSGVRFNSIDNFISRGNFKYTVLRIKNKYKNKLSFVKEEALSYKGLPYDNSFYFADDKIYCSELVYRAFEKGAGIEMGEVKKVKDVIGIHSYNPILKGIVDKFLGRISMDQKVITPDALMKAVNFNIAFEIE